MWLVRSDELLFFLSVYSKWFNSELPLGKSTKACRLVKSCISIMTQYTSVLYYGAILFIVSYLHITNIHSYRYGLHWTEYINPNIYVSMDKIIITFIENKD